MKESYASIAADQLGLVQLQLQGTIAGPTGIYARLLWAGPVFGPVAGAWLVSQYADVRAVLAHPAGSVRMDHAATLARFPGSASPRRNTGLPYAGCHAPSPAPAAQRRVLRRSVTRRRPARRPRR